MAQGIVAAVAQAQGIGRHLAYARRAQHQGVGAQFEARPPAAAAQQYTAFEAAAHHPQTHPVEQPGLVRGKVQAGDLGTVPGGQLQGRLRRQHLHRGIGRHHHKRVDDQADRCAVEGQDPQGLVAAQAVPSPCPLSSTPWATLVSVKVPLPLFW